MDRSAKPHAAPDGSPPAAFAPAPPAGFKHALVAILAATVATGRAASLRAIPAIDDARTLAAIVRALGGTVAEAGDAWDVDARGVHLSEVPDDLAAQSHSSLYLMPAVLARTGRVVLGPSGGCQIGAACAAGRRPVAHMISVLERFGAHIECSGERVVGWCDGLRPCDIDIMSYSDRPDILTGPWVSGATKTAILAASVADGPSVIRHPYAKPDVTELLLFLEAGGYRVERRADSLVIGPPDDGGTAGPVRHTLVPDLGVVITYIAWAVCRKRTAVLGGLDARLRHGLEPEFSLLGEMGVRLTWRSDELLVEPADRLRSVHIEVTSVGIYSDHQPFFALMLLGADRAASMREQVWTERFGYCAELRKLRARVAVHGDRLDIEPSELAGSGQTLIAGDLRAAATLLLAAGMVDGPNIVTGVHHLHRGYEDLPATLRREGVTIRELDADTVEVAGPVT